MNRNPGFEMGTAVQVQNAWKYYKVNGEPEPVLRGLNMSVPRGAMYCLLGSSGGGKTTLLSSILNLRKLNKGRIRVFGEQPGTNNVGIPGKNVGYMPQDVTLYGEFSILETLRYFGTLNGMTKQQVDDKSQFLEALLDLPPLTRRINTLSGGQQRRVSFAVALIHNPKLLILDEPTVGVDPLLRQKIWTYLRSLTSSEGTTIIITTHYLESARKADLIGIMRGGIMIAETSPTQLINSDAAGSLQNAVLALCKRGSLLGNNESGNVGAEGVNWVNVTNVSPRKATVPRKQLLEESVTRITAIVRKNVAILFRNLLLLFGIICIPAIDVFAVNISFGNAPSNMRVGVINQELNVSQCPEVSPVQGECALELLSCAFLSNLPSGKLDLIPYKLEQDAEAAIHSGSIRGYLIFSPVFSSSVYERATLGVSVDDITLNSSTIIVKLDDTSKPVSASIKVALHDALEDFTSALLTNCGFDSRQGLSPFQYGTPVFGKDDAVLKDFAAPGMAVVMIFFWPIVTVGVRFVEERKSGMLERSIVAGVHNWEIFLAFLISESFILIPQTVLTLAVALLMMEIKIVGSIYLAFGLLLLVSCCAASLGFLFGSLCRDKMEIPILAVGSFIPNVMLSGIYWPVEGMPVSLQYVVNLLPCTLSAESIRSILSRGWDLSHDNVWPGFAVLAVHTLLYFFLTILLHKVIKSS